MTAYTVTIYQNDGADELGTYEITASHEGLARTRAMLAMLHSKARQRFTQGSEITYSVKEK